LKTVATFTFFDSIRDITEIRKGKGKIHILIGKNGVGKTLLLKHLASGKCLLEKDIHYLTKNLSIFNHIMDSGPQNVTYIYQNAKEQFLGNTINDELILIRNNYELKNHPLDNTLCNKSFEELSHGNQQYANVLTGMQRISNILIIDEIDAYIDSNRVNSITSRICLDDTIKHCVFTTHRTENYLHLDPTIYKCTYYDENKHSLALEDLFKQVQHIIMQRIKTNVSLVLEKVMFKYWDQPIITNYCRTFLGPGYHEIYGKNGSGKSTLLRLISRQFRPNKGKIKYNPKKISVFHLPQRYDAFFLTDDLCTEANRYGISLTFTISLNEFSKGQRKIIALLLCLAADADLYLLDEPYEELEIEWVQKMKTLISHLSSKKLIINTSLDDKLTNVT